MSAFDRMLTQQIEKMLSQALSSLPPEVAQHLTPEGFAKLGEQAAAMVQYFRVGVAVISEQNKAILANQKVIMAAMGSEHEHRDYTGSGGNPVPGITAQRDAA